MKGLTSSSIIWYPNIFPGIIAFASNSTKSSDFLITSILSPFISSITFLILCPLTPIIEPTGSTSGWFDETTILVLKPGSLATSTISTTPSATSSISLSNNFLINSLLFLDAIICASFETLSTSII